MNPPPQSDRLADDLLGNRGKLFYITGFVIGHGNLKHHLDKMKIVFNTSGLCREEAEPVVQIVCECTILVSIWLSFRNEKLLNVNAIDET